MQQQSYRLDRNDRNPRLPYGDLLWEGTVSPSKAFASLIIYELGYGGTITELSETKLIVQTCVMSKIDHVVFEGTKEEMEPLLQYVAIFHQLSSEDDIGRIFDALEGTALKEKLLRPLYLTTAGIMMVGGSRAHRAMIGFLVEKEGQVEQLSQYDLKDLVALGQLVIEGASRSEAIATLDTVVEA
ncbi:hypothetical protein LUCX_98 [Xanthomonas phage vB_XciM_LucasX]|nr:hypothetical protein LUCX_98 [Xanthomonas phage vB_XciM_LucasX]